MPHSISVCMELSFDAKLTEQGKVQVFIDDRELKSGSESWKTAPDASADLYTIV